MQALRKHPLRIATVIFAIVVCAVAAYLLLREPVREMTPDRLRYPLVGVDLSAHNNVENWQLLSRNVDFVILKATEGGNWNDRKFENSYRMARKYGLKTGAYHFFRFDRDGIPQAINLYNAIYGKKLDFPVIIDVEQDGNPEGIPDNIVRKRLATMVDFLRQHGVEVMFYTNKNGYQDYVRPLYPEHPLWLCSLSSEPDSSLPWLIWQYSHSGNIPGIQGKVDLNTVKSR